jgi:hypothetical protein
VTPREAGGGLGAALEWLRGPGRWLVGALAFGAVTIVTVLIARPRMLTGFATYDDEGYMLVALRSFVDGGSLYEEVFSQYGPFYYELWGSIFPLFGIEVDLDSGRVVTLVVWVLASLILGLSVFRMTDSIVLGTVAQMLAFAALIVAPNEPMHPGGLISLLLVLILAVSCLVRERPSLIPIGVLGGLLAALTLTKVNVGAFAVAAVALLCVVSYFPLSRRSWLRILIEAGFVALPAVLMASDFGEAWARGYAFHVTAAALTVVIALRAREVSQRDPGELWWIVGGFVLATAAILLALLGAGTGLSGLYDGVVGQPLKQADAFSIPFPYVDRFVLLDALALATAIAYWFAARSRSGGTTPWQPLVSAFSILVGIEIALAAIGKTLPFDSLGSPGYQFGLLAFAWIALIPVPGQGAGTTFARTLLPLLAVMQALHAYPVAGSQIAWSTFLLIPVGLLCVANGARGLMTVGSSSERRVVMALGAVVAAILVLFVADATLRRPLRDIRAAYDAAMPLDLPGARTVRLAPEEVDVYRHVTASIDTYCNAFLTLPGLNSFYFWTEQEPPTGSNATAWTSLFDEARQRRVVDGTRRIPNLCLLEHESLALGWTGGTIPDGPLVRYLKRGFEPVTTIGDYRLLRRDEPEAPPQ